MRDRCERISWTEPKWHYRPYAREQMRPYLAPITIVRILVLMTLIVGPFVLYLTRKFPEVSWFWIVLLSWAVTAFSLCLMALASLFPRSVALDSESITIDSFGSRRTYRLWDLREVAITRLAKGRYVFEFRLGDRAFKIGISHKVDTGDLKTFIEQHVPETIKEREVAQQDAGAEG